jgi:shikimate kinase
VVLNRINIDRLKTEGVIVLLTASEKTILRRTATDGGRPLLLAEDRAARIHELLRFRWPFYIRAADVIVNTSRLSVEAVVCQIIDRLREIGSFSFPE